MLAKYTFLFFIILCINTQVAAQIDINWQWQQMADMPNAVSNNAVCGATVNDVPYIYSFGGIDTSKVWSGISNKSYRYNTQTNAWESIADLPDEMPKIAAGASTVKNKIYIIGGYTVLSSGNEISSNKIHIYNPETNTYENDGAPIPVAIDDQVQAVYKDSLIYVVTGWSNTTNVRDVQIYDTYNNTWQEGTPVLIQGDYRVFGGSGAIIGDTIYYAGGAGLGANFQLTSSFRKGYINPNNPTEITWQTTENDSLALGYRQGVTQIGDSIFWIGGSSVSYNYDGIAYNGSGGVAADSRVVSYNPFVGSLTSFPIDLAIMDLRGVAQTNEALYIAGGMQNNQMVSNKLFKLVLVEPVSVLENEYSTFILSSNFIEDYLMIKTNTKDAKLNIYNLSGQIEMSIHSVTNELTINVSHLKKGYYFISLQNENFTRSTKFLKQ